MTHERVADLKGRRAADRLELILGNIELRPEIGRSGYGFQYCRCCISIDVKIGVALLLVIVLQPLGTLPPLQRPLTRLRRCSVGTRQS